MLKVGFDESGSHEPSTVFGMAACAGQTVHWSQLERDWGPRAEHYIKGYHATKADAKDNEFLAGVMERWLWGYALTISYEDFKLVTHDLRSKYGSIYLTAL